MFKGMNTGHYYSQNCDINISVEKLEQSTVSMKMTEMVMLNIVQGNGQSQYMLLWRYVFPECLHVSSNQFFTEL